MNTLSVKEEHANEDVLCKVVKNEEPGNPKQEEIPYPYPVPVSMPFHPYFPMRPMPSWFNTMMRGPYMHPMYNYGYFDPTCYMQMPQKKMFSPFPEPFPMNPAVMAKKVKEDEGGKNSLTKLKKKSIRVSACKNYIGLLCAGFSRAVLTSERTSPILKYAAELVTQRKERFTSAENQTIEQLVETLRVYIHQNICGKKIKKSNRERDFKVRNSEELDKLLIAQENDTELTCLRKEILREMINFFFESDCYDAWLSKGMISESNRVFFVRNKKEIHKKFQNPAYYKPRFNHNQDEAIFV